MMIILYEYSYYPPDFNSINLEFLHAATRCATCGAKRFGALRFVIVVVVVFPRHAHHWCGRGCGEALVRGADGTRNSRDCVRSNGVSFIIFIRSYY